MTEAENGNRYVVNRDGMVTLCADQADAQEAKDAQEVWPHMGPHRAVQLAPAGGRGKATGPAPQEPSHQSTQLAEMIRWTAVAAATTSPYLTALQDASRPT